MQLPKTEEFFIILKAFMIFVLGIWGPVHKSIKFPQLTRYFKSLLLACVAASFKFWSTDLANLSLLTSKGVSEN